MDVVSFTPYCLASREWNWPEDEVAGSGKSGWGGRHFKNLGKWKEICGHLFSPFVSQSICPGRLAGKWRDRHCLGFYLAQLSCISLLQTPHHFHYLLTVQNICFCSGISLISYDFIFINSYIFNICVLLGRWARACVRYTSGTCIKKSLYSSIPGISAKARVLNCWGSSLERVCGQYLFDWELILLSSRGEKSIICSHLLWI